MNNAIELKHVCKKYPGFELKDISFCIPEGLCCGFVGPNGAGKTTTLKAMTGMLFQDSGEIRLLDRPNSDVSVREDIGILFDQPYFQEDWTPCDIEKSIRPFYRNWDSTLYRQYLSRFGLDPKKKFKNFSKGMKLKLSLTVHLSHDARLLLFDEPTSGLDPAVRDELLDILREYMVTDGRTIFFSTHITSDLERLADLIVYISNGSIAYCGDKEELTSSYCLVRGGRLPESKREFAIGLREHASGYECLMALPHIGGLPSDTMTEHATIDDVVVYMERNAKNV